MNSTHTESCKISIPKGRYAIVDRDDYEYLGRYNWYELERGHLARETTKKDKIPRQILYMARIVNKTPKGLGTIHRNGDKLDCRKKNLLSANKSQVMQNQKNRTGVTSVYRGVSWNSERGKWQAGICVKGVRMNLGAYSDELEAKHAYEKTATKYFGEFARINDDIL